MLNSDSSKTSSFAKIIKTAQENINAIKSLGITIPSNSWLNHALIHSQATESFRKRGAFSDFISDASIRWKTTVVFGNLSEFNFIMHEFDKLIMTSEDVFKKKLKEVINMPLRAVDENAAMGTNLGRNTLFELRLAARFSEVGFSPKLSFSHPDILIPTKERDYAIECKRMFSVNSFEQLTIDAINQLKKNSLADSNSRLGIVAISITRNFNQGDKKISTESEESLGKFADRQTEIFIRKHSEFIQRVFPKKIPAIILDFSDLAESIRPLWVNWVYIVGTAKDSDQTYINILRKDLQSFHQPKI